MSQSLLFQDAGGACIDLIYAGPVFQGGFDEKPQQEIYLAAFYVDKYEVTVKAYNVFRKNAAYVKSCGFRPRE